MKKYYEISERFVDDGVELECVKHTSCCECHYTGKDCVSMMCNPESRIDKIAAMYVIPPSSPIIYNKPFIDGQWAWHSRNGWGKIRISTMSGINYPVIFINALGGCISFNQDGFQFASDKFRSLFHEPPPHINDPRPEEESEFTRGDKVEVRDSADAKWLRRYYSRFDKGFPAHRTFVNGADEWSSKGKTSLWNYCRKWSAH